MVDSPFKSSACKYSIKYDIVANSAKKRGAHALTGNEEEKGRKQGCRSHHGYGDISIFPRPF